jgi:hypothetical protein
LGQRTGRGLRETVHSDDFLTLNDVAKLAGKMPSNISYLVQYDRLRRYNSHGAAVQKAANGELRVSKGELLAYIATWNSRIRSRMRSLQIDDMSLAFHEVPERERTKHVHRLHPYLGKFIPQLVEYFLSRYFSPGQFVIDPFSGSGTTLVQASEMGISSIGIDVSEFNVMISRVKLAEYDIPRMEKEVLDIARRTTEFSSGLPPRRGGRSEGKFAVESDYLKTWFAPRSTQEMLYFRSIIPEYSHQDLLRVLLSRTARSCRLVHHYDLATPKKPVRGPYVCYKHKGKICEPVTTIVPRLNFYSRDTIKRVKAFAEARRPSTSTVMEGDSRFVRIEEGMPERRRLDQGEIGGVFTSPPYVGQIDYHEQHRYAYELFGIGRRDELEIGPKAGGKGERAKADYSRSMTEALGNIGRYLSPTAAVLVVANDKLNLYPQIFDGAQMRIEKSFLRPVEDRTERDKRPYSETVFLARLNG